MEHELLHNEPEYNLRLSNKVKREKEKVDPGERKKWNFRKSNASETGGKRSPSPTSGLIHQSTEVRSKRTISPTMIFENKISDHDYIDEQTELSFQSSPTATSPPPTSVQHKFISPKAVTQPTPDKKRLRQNSFPMSTSPPLISIPQSIKKTPERILRQTSVPVKGSPVQPLSKVTYPQTPVQGNSEHCISSPATLHTDGPDIQRSISVDVPSNNQWKSVQQPLFPSSDKLQQEEMTQRHRIMEKDSPSGEAVNESTSMWQGNKQQELTHEKWTDFSSITNEVFVPDDRAWAVAENIAVEADENGQHSSGDASNSSRSSNSSESDSEQENEESVWRINEEQRAYYLNQFRILQPAEKGVVTGQKARDFFLKSGLTTDVLSKIWNLADLDNDGALNFEEFCIAMHVVVAVRHGLEVPTALPHYLIPEQHEKEAPVVSPKKVEPSSHEQLPVPESPQTWARFSPDPQNPKQMVLPEAEDSTKVQPVAQPHRHLERTMSDPSTLDENTAKDNSNQIHKKMSLEIPRVRGSIKQTNLLDTPHWAILPPPSKFTKDTTEDSGKSVPIGTIIPEDTGASDHAEQQPPLLRVEKAERPSPRDSESNSSSSDNEETVGEKERPQSNENVDSASSGSLSKGSSRDSVGVGQDSVDGGGKSSAPTPPPRKKMGHSRSSSLDLQKLFINKGGSNSFQNTTNGTDDKDTAQPAHESQENFADFSKFDNNQVSHPPENFSRHRRSASLDSTHAIWVEPSQPTQNQSDQGKESSTSRQEVSTSLPRPIPKKKPASPPPPLRQKKDTQPDNGSDGIVEKEKKTSKEPIHFVVKPLTRLEQLHARIRDLQTKNTRLSRVNNELQQELKQMMEIRTGLETSLEQLKPLSKG